MSALQWILLGIGGLVVLAGVGMGGGLVYLSRNQPPDAGVAHGVQDGRLAACPATPNCVSTQAPENDRRHYAEPIRYAGTVDEARDRVEEWLAAQENVRRVRDDRNYLRVVFRSRVFGFQDDFEVLLQQPGDAKEEGNGAVIVHVRSAARVGQGDMGVNRSRYESLRDALLGDQRSDS